jgi:hypothetical protein
VVHEVGPAGDGARRDRQRLDLVRPRLRRRRRYRAGRSLIEVVEESHADAALGRRAQRAEDDRLGVVVQVDIVDRDVERPLRALDERREETRDLDRRLAAVAERSKLDQAEACARIFALCSRFAAW